MIKVVRFDQSVLQFSGAVKIEKGVKYFVHNGLGDFIHGIEGIQGSGKVMNPYFQGIFFMSRIRIKRQDCD